MRLRGPWNSKGRRKIPSRLKDVYGGRLLAQRRHDAGADRASQVSTESINDEMDIIALVRRAAQAAAREPQPRQTKTKAAVAAAVPVPSVLARAIRKVVVAVCLGLFLVGGLRIASRAGLLDEIVSRSAPPAQSQQVSVQEAARLAGR
jgi:hypothetical protein